MGVWRLLFNWWNATKRRNWHYIKCGLNEEYRVVPETVGQYIGIKDKNNIEIYENDLIKLDAVIFQVKWSKLLAGFVGKFNNEHELFACYQNLYKIVGNIHDNPEMLEV